MGKGDVQAICFYCGNEHPSCKMFRRTGTGRSFYICPKCDDGKNHDAKEDRVTQLEEAANAKDKKWRDAEALAHKKHERKDDDQNDDAPGLAEVADAEAAAADIDENIEKLETELG